MLFSDKNIATWLSKIQCLQIFVSTVTTVENLYRINSEWIDPQNESQKQTKLHFGLQTKVIDYLIDILPENHHFMSQR